MTDKIRIVVDEETSIVTRLDELAQQEGLSRSDMIRRAIRRLLLAPVVVPSSTPAPDDLSLKKR